MTLCLCGKDSVVILNGSKQKNYCIDCFKTKYNPNYSICKEKKLNDNFFSAKN